MGREELSLPGAFAPGWFAVSEGPRLVCGRFGVPRLRGAFPHTGGMKFPGCLAAGSGA